MKIAKCTLILIKGYLNKNFFVNWVFNEFVLILLALQPFFLVLTNQEINFQASGWFPPSMSSCWRIYRMLLNLSSRKSPLISLNGKQCLPRKTCRSQNCQPFRKQIWPEPLSSRFQCKSDNRSLSALERGIGLPQTLSPARLWRFSWFFLCQFLWQSSRWELYSGWSINLDTGRLIILLGFSFGFLRLPLRDKLWLLFH